MTNRRYPTGGALPPDTCAWQLGKTAGSIQFVNYAERCIASFTDEKIKAALQRAVDRVKSGELVVNYSPQDFYNDFIYRRN
jgi:LmbE family N-acetylglucosaminyl deacetylase